MSRGRRGLLTFGVGLVATVVGAGIAPAWLRKDGWSPVAVAGLVALAAGVVLLAYGAVALVRAARRWWRLLVVPVVLAVTYVSLWSGMQAVIATNVPPTAVGADTPAASGLSYQDVEFVTADGVLLSGWYLPSDNGAAVVLLHGSGSTRSAVLGHAVVLARHGYGVLLYDARGHGRSGGRAMDFGWYGDRDVTAAVSFLVAQPDVDDSRIGAVGLSMGGEQALGAAAADPRLRAVVAEGATHRVAGDKAYLERAYGARGRVQQAIDRVTTALTDLLTAAGPPITLRAAAGAAGPRPVLLIAAGAVAEEGLAARYIQDGNAHVQVWEAPGAGHTGGLAATPAEWQRRVTAFLDGALAVPGA